MSAASLPPGTAAPAARWATSALAEYFFLALTWAWRLQSEAEFRFWPYCPAVLMAWLLVRGPILRRQYQLRRTPAVGSWLESHLTGLTLAIALAFFFLGVSAPALPGLVGWSMATLLSVEFAENSRARRLAARWILRRWTAIWPQAGELAAIIASVWIWQRLTGIGPLPLPIFAWIGGSAGAVLTLTRGQVSPWRSLIAPVIVLIPLVLTFVGLPEAQPHSRLALLLAGALAAPWVHRRFLARGSGRRSERLAWIWLLVLSSLWLSDPLLHAQAVGAGDAQWYTTVLADAIAQTRAGIFPPLVGQSNYAFNGSIFPGAFAPYYPMAGVTLYVLTAGALPVYSIQHLLAFGSIVGGMLAVHWVLRRQTGAAHSYCAALAVLYGACPAWLGAIYSMDMYMTLLTMPWLPLVFHGCLHCFRRLDAPAIVWTALPLALVYLAHPPIGVWTSLMVALVHLWRVLAQRRGWGAELRWGLGTGVLFSALICLPVVFTLLTEPQSDAFRHGYVMETLAEHWRNAWLPVSAGAARISDQQLGWSVSLLAVAGFGVAIARRGDHTRAFLPGVAWLGLLLAPIPVVHSALWQAMPEMIKSITDNWPTQRLLPILAGLSIVAGGTALLRCLSETRRIRTGLTAGLLMAVCWSLGEAQKFRARGYAVTATPEISVKRLLPENNVLSRYAYYMFGQLPHLYSDGVMNPVLHQGLYRLDTLQPITTNLETAYANVAAQAFALQPNLASPDQFDLCPTLHLMPGREYFLKFELNEPLTPGTLVFLGDRLEREYLLATETGGNAIGNAEGQRRHISLWNTGDSLEEVRIQFHPLQPGQPVENLGYLRISEMPTASLPVQLEGQSPYRATVRAPEPAWLETSRMYIPGYTATYNGKPAEVRISPQNLVLVRVPAGTGRVELVYSFPPPLRAALFLTGATWSALGLALGARLWLRSRRPPPLAHHQYHWVPQDVHAPEG